jgi:hypothetical protein
LPFKDAVKATRAWFNARLRPLTVRSAALGKVVGFNTTGRNKSTSFAGDRRKLAVMAALPDIIRDGELLSSEPPRDLAIEPTVRAYHILQGDVDLAGERLGTRVIVRETNNGAFHYDHYIVEDSPASPGARSDPATKRGSGTPGGETD